MSAGQEVGPLDREGRSLIQPPLPPDEATRALAAAAGVSTVGLRPSFVTPAAAHSHPDCRAILILIVAPQAEAKSPAVPIRRSVTPDYLICLEDGKRFKSLRRHLGALGLTPEQYREKWKLPSDYPMVAPNYAAQRSALARKLGLGQKRKAG